MMKMTRELLVAVILLTLAFSDASAQSAKDKWSGDAQRCAVENCNPSTPTPPASSDDSPPMTRRERKAANARYNKIVKDVDRELELAPTFADVTVRINVYQDALGLLHAQQALRDGPNVRNRISQVEAWLLWSRGILDDQNKKYWTAYLQLDQARKARPELFSEGNFYYKQAVLQRHIASPTVQPRYDPTLVPDEVLHSAITDPITGVFYGSPDGVSERVRRGFQAVMVKDFNLARAWFADALNHDPGDVNLKNFIAIIDGPYDRTYSGLPARVTLADLHANQSSMSDEQVIKALDDILWIQFIEALN